MTITLMTNACQQLNQKKSEQMVPFKIREIAKCTLLPFFIFDQNNCVNCCFIFTWHWNTITNQKMGKVIEGYKKFPFSLHYSPKVTIFLISLKMAPFQGTMKWQQSWRGKREKRSASAFAIFSTPGKILKNLGMVKNWKYSQNIVESGYEN